MTATLVSGMVVNLGPVAMVPMGEGRVFRVAGKNVAVFRARSGDIYATQAECPHEGGPLADGIMGGGKIICPMHANKFDLATGKPVGNDCAALNVYHAAVNADGEIELSLED